MTTNLHVFSVLTGRCIRKAKLEQKNIWSLELVPELIFPFNYEISAMSMVNTTAIAIKGAFIT